MEVLVKNVYKRSKEFYKNIYAYYMFKRPVIIVLDCLALVLLALYLAAKLYYLVWLVLAIPMIQVISYVKNLRAGQNRDMEISGGDGVTIEMLAYDSHIDCLLSTGASVKVEYSNIKKAKELNGYVYLITKSKLVYAFKNDGYLKGDHLTLLRILNAKGIMI